MSLAPDVWLTEQLRRPVHRCTGGEIDAVPRGMTYAKIGVDDAARFHRLIGLGFHLVDTAVSFESPLPLSRPIASAGARMARTSDAEAIRSIVRASFRHDRFHADPQITDAEADAIKVAWIDSHFTGTRGEWMVVAETNAEVAGFLLLLRQGKTLVIDLIATADWARDRGLAKAMIGYAATTIGSFAAMRVGTQVTNVASIRLYESLGFRFTGAQYVLHCHR